MLLRIKAARDGKLAACLESTEGFPALAMLEKRLGKNAFRSAPADIPDSFAADEDRLAVCRADSLAGKVVSRALALRFAGIKPGGYRIECRQKNGRNTLVVAGGDLFGMLAGLADVLLNLEKTSAAWIYRGDSRIENPAFPLRYYWTWDHSTNWVLDDEGNQHSGCQNRYLKKPETYLEDYRRLVDHCLEMRFNGVLIWGFLRDSHGGERYAYEIAKYAADRGVAIMPGVGTTGYGGIYYDGQHPCNLETYLARHPRRRNTGKGGKLSPREISPYYPENQAWIAGALEWLYRSFPIGGINLENSDLLVDYSRLGRLGRAKIKSREADYYKDQFFAYKTALDVAHRLAPDKWNTYATYSGFGDSQPGRKAGSDRWIAPYFSKRMPKSAIAQWTISGMVSEKPLPLRAWLDASRPAAVYNNPNWPKGLCPPTPRSAGFLHQASQWSNDRRQAVVISAFVEGCLRGFESGLEGITVHGEVISRALAWKLNYLAMRHWTYHPVSTLEEFASAELAPRLGRDQEAARSFIKALCLIEEGKHGEATRIGERYIGKYGLSNGPFYPGNYPDRGDNEVFRLWNELREWDVNIRCCRTPLHGFTDII
jgi:hypothetical protein